MDSDKEVEYDDRKWHGLELHHADPLTLLIRAEEGDEEALAFLRGW